MSTTDNCQETKKTYQRQTPPKNSTGSCQPQKGMFVRDNPSPNHPTYPGGSGFGPIPPSSVFVDQSAIRLKKLKQRIDELEALVHEGKPIDKSDLAECYTELALEYRFTHDAKCSDDAQILFQKAIAIWETPGIADTPKAIKYLLECYDRRGRNLFDFHRYDEALTIYQKALTILDNTDIDLGGFDASMVYEYYAKTLYKLRKFNEYLEIRLKYRQLISSKTRKPSGLSRNQATYTKISIITADKLEHLGYISGAFAAYETAISFLLANEKSLIDYSREEGFIKYADMLYKHQFYEKALVMYQKAITIMEENKESENKFHKNIVAYTYLKCAYTLYKLERSNDALLMCKKGISLYEIPPCEREECCQLVAGYMFANELMNDNDSPCEKDGILEKAFNMLDTMDENQKETVRQEMSKWNVRISEELQADIKTAGTLDDPKDKAEKLYTYSVNLDMIGLMDEAANILSEVIAIQEKLTSTDMASIEMLEKLESSYVFYYEILHDLGRLDEALIMRKKAIRFMTNHK